MPDETLRLRATIDHQQAMTGLAQVRREIDKTAQATKKANEQSAEAYKKSAREVKAYGDTLRQTGEHMTGFSFSAAGAGAAVGALAQALGSALLGTFNELATIRLRARALSVTTEELRGLGEQFKRTGLTTGQAEQQIKSFRATMDQIVLKGAAFDTLLSRGAPNLVNALSKAKDMTEQLTMVWKFAQGLNDQQKRAFAKDMGIDEKILFYDHERFRQYVQEEKKLSEERLKNLEDLKAKQYDIQRAGRHGIEAGTLSGAGAAGSVGKFMDELPKKQSPVPGRMPRGFKRTSFGGEGDFGSDADTGGDERPIRIVREGVLKGMQLFASGEDGEGGGSGSGSGSGSGAQGASYGGGGDDGATPQKASYSPPETPATTGTGPTGKLPGGPAPAAPGGPATPAAPGGPATPAAPGGPATPTTGGPGGGLIQAQGKEAATRKGALTPELAEGLDYAAKKMGLTAKIVSGGQRMPGAPGATGTHRHDQGEAGDLQLIDPKTGERIPSNDPRAHEFMKEAASTGRVKGGGSGYRGMGKYSLHADTGKHGGPYGPDKGTQRALREGMAEAERKRKAGEPMMPPLPKTVGPQSMKSMGPGGIGSDTANYVDSAMGGPEATGKVNVTVNSNGPGKGGGPRNDLFQPPSAKPHTQMVETNTQDL